MAKELWNSVVFTEIGMLHQYSNDDELPLEMIEYSFSFDKLITADCVLGN